MDKYQREIINLPVPTWMGGGEGGFSQGCVLPSSLC